MRNHETCFVSSITLNYESVNKKRIMKKRVTDAHDSHQTQRIENWARTTHWWIFMRWWWWSICLSVCVQCLCVCVYLCLLSFVSSFSFSISQMISSLSLRGSPVSRRCIVSGVCVCVCVSYLVPAAVCRRSADCLSVFLMKTNGSSERMWRERAPPSASSARAAPTHKRTRRYTHRPAEGDAHSHTRAHTYTHAHTHVVFYGLRGLSIGVMVFIQYKLYVLLPYTYPTPKLSPHRRRCISIFPQKNSLCMIYKRFELWGHWMSYPMSYPCHYTNLCPHKPHKHAPPPHTHTHTLSLSLSPSHTHTRAYTHTHTLSSAT